MKPHKPGIRSRPTIAAGFDDHYSKPIDFDALIDAIRERCRSGSAFCISGKNGD
jgi:hypothetical protein